MRFFDHVQPVRFHRTFISSFHLSLVNSFTSAVIGIFDIFSLCPTPLQRALLQQRLDKG
jgi:hypothetical protein